MSPTHRNTRIIGWWIVGALVLAGGALAQEAEPPMSEEPWTDGGPDTGMQDTGAQAANASEFMVRTPDDIEWQPAEPPLPAETRIAILSGDPMQDGLVTMRIELPANFDVPAHSHPSDEHVTIIEGNATVTLEDGPDAGNTTELPTGSFFALPANTSHSFSTGNETVVLQIHGHGPWGLEYQDDGNATEGADAMDAGAPGGPDGAGAGAPGPEGNGNGGAPPVPA